MIKVRAIYNGEHEICGFRSEGHAGFAKSGSDIICAAVSVLALNTVNSIDAFTEDKFSCKQHEDGFLELVLTEHISHESKLLLNSFFLGIKSIEDEYGAKYVNLLK